MDGGGGGGELNNDPQTCPSLDPVSITLHGKRDCTDVIKWRTEDPGLSRMIVLIRERHEASEEKGVRGQRQRLECAFWGRREGLQAKEYRWSQGTSKRPGASFSPQSLQEELALLITQFTTNETHSGFLNCWDCQKTNLCCFRPLS